MCMCKGFFLNLMLPSESCEQVSSQAELGLILTPRLFSYWLPNCSFFFCCYCSRNMGYTNVSMRSEED